jgi:heptosyltransferase-3
MTTFVHHDGALGDVLLSLPCLQALRLRGETVHFAGRRDLGRLLRDTKVVGESSDAGSRSYAGLYTGDANAELRSFLGGYRRAVVFTVDSGGPVASALRRIISDIRTVVTMPPPGSRISAARYRLGQLDPAALSEIGRSFLTVPAPLQGLTEAMLSRWGWKGDRPLVMVHPGSGGRGKCWPLERYFSAVTDILEEEDAFVILFTGPAEDDLFLDQVEAYCRNHEHTVHVGDTDLTALAALLARSGAYVGNDSGVSHLAAAVGAPTIALFGPTDPVIWGPVGKRVTIIAEGSLDDISVERVVSTVRALLSEGSPDEGSGGDAREG